MKNFMLIKFINIKTYMEGWGWHLSFKYYFLIFLYCGSTRPIFASRRSEFDASPDGGRFFAEKLPRFQTVQTAPQLPLKFG